MSNVNCIAFRRKATEFPGCEEREFVAHYHRCERCAAYLDELRRVDAIFKKSMAGVVPEDIESRILLKQAFRRRPTWWRRPVVAMALAASLVLAIAAGLLVDRGPSHPPLNAEVVELINQAAHALVPQDPVDPAVMQAALKPAGVAIGDPIGVVTFASPCIVRGKMAGHLVVRGELAPISVLLIPGTAVEGTQIVKGPDLEGLLVPSSHGTIAVVGVPGEALDAIVARLRSSVRWQV